MPRRSKNARRGYTRASLYATLMRVMSGEQVNTTLAAVNTLVAIAIPLITVIARSRAPKPRDRGLVWVPPGSTTRPDGVVEKPYYLLNPLPPLPRPVNPWVALVLGFFLSGVGIALYFRTWIDLFASIVLVVVTVLPVFLVDAATGVTYFTTAALPALYGFFRARASEPSS